MSGGQRWSADHVAVVVAVVVLSVAISAASFVLSFHGLRDVAGWGNVPPSLAWLVPVMVDAALLAYTLAWLVRRARGESGVLSWCALGLFTVVSTLGNALHGWQPTEPVQRIIGTVVVGLAPLAVLLATHTLAQLLTTHTKKPATTETADEATEALARWASDATLWRAPGDGLDRLRARRRGPGVDPRARVHQLHADGLTLRAIAAEVGLSKSTVHAIVKAAA